MKILFVLLLTSLCVSAWCGTIVQNGAPKAVIVSGSDATEPEKNAAEELAKYLKAVSGADIDIVSEASDTLYNIYVGQTEAVKALMPDYDWTSLKSDGIVMKSTKDYLVLAGDRPRGTLYAVYDFLEKYLGVRYWTPYSEKVPVNKNITLPNNIDYSYTPPFMSREAFFNLNIEHNDFAVKQKSNGRHNFIDEEWGGHIDLIGWAHTFAVFISPDEYFDEHPEWFSMLDGKRSRGYTQLCLSNDECVHELGNKVLERLRKEKNPSIISVTQNDNASYCQCEKCTALAEKYGGQSGLILHAVNQVADRVKEEFPDVLVETFAYWYTVDAPKDIKPRDNMIIRLCNIQNNFGTPLYECLQRPEDESQKVNASFYKSLNEWSRITKNLFIWNYIVDFTSYYMLHPNFHCLKPDLQTFRDHHAVAIFEQGDSFNETPCMNALKGYLTAKLLWNPDIDDDAVIHEFLDGYYGAAGPCLYNVITRAEGEIKQHDVNLRCYMPNMSWMSDEALVYCFDNFNRALSAVSGDKVLEDRVMNELLSFQWGWFTLPEERREAVRNSGVLLMSDENRYGKFFYDWALGHNNKYSREGGLFTLPKITIEKPLKKSDNRPEGVTDDNGWFEITADDFELAYVGRCSDLIDDPDTSTGKAALLYYNSFEWALQRRFNKAINKAVDDGYKKAEFYITARREGEASADPEERAFQFMIYEWSNNTAPVDVEVKVKDLKNTYSTIKMAEANLQKGWDLGAVLIPLPYERLGKALAVDRIYAVLKK